MPIQKGVAGITACCGEPEDRPSFFFFLSGAYQPSSRSDCSGLYSGYQCVWIRMTPIGADRGRQFKPQERRNWDRRAQGVLAPSEYVERARSLGVSCISFLLEEGDLQWSARIFKAESPHLPMGHGRKFPVICGFY